MAEDTQAPITPEEGEQTPATVVGAETTSAAKGGRAARNVVATPVEATVTVQASKKIKVLALADHNCTIGGVEIHLVKGREASLTEDAATILQHAGKCMKR